MTTATQDVLTGTSRTDPLWKRVIRQREIGLVALLVLTTVIVSLRSPAFLSAGNFRDILVYVTPSAIICCSMTLVIVTGEIDISVGSLMGLLAAVMGILASPTHRHLNPVLVGLIVLILATIVGAVNGLLVTVAGMPSIIVTLGMLTALQGVTSLVLAGESVSDLPPGLTVLGKGAILGIPISLLVTVVVILLSLVLARETPLGRRIFAVGSNVRAARLAGLSERNIKLFVFTLNGFLTGIATLVSVTQLPVIESGIGQGLELLVVTCVVVGGTSISGGQGNIIGSLLAALLLGMIRTVLIFLHLGEHATYWERAVQGVFILVAVLADHLTQRRGASETHG